MTQYFPYYFRADEAQMISNKKKNKKTQQPPPPLGTDGFPNTQRTPAVAIGDLTKQETTKETTTKEKQDTGVDGTSSRYHKSSGCSLQRLWGRDANPFAVEIHSSPSHAPSLSAAADLMSDALVKGLFWRLCSQRFPCNRARCDYCGSSV